MVHEHNPHQSHTQPALAHNTHLLRPDRQARLAANDDDLGLGGALHTRGGVGGGGVWGVVGWGWGVVGVWVCVVGGWVGGVGGGGWGVGGGGGAAPSSQGEAGAGVQHGPSSSSKPAWRRLPPLPTPCTAKAPQLWKAHTPAATACLFKDHAHGHSADVRHNHGGDVDAGDGEDAGRQLDAGGGGGLAGGRGWGAGGQSRGR